MDAREWKIMGHTFMALADYIEKNGGNARAAYDAAEDAFSRAKELTEEGTTEHERLKALQYNAQANGRGKK